MTLLLLIMAGTAALLAMDAGCYLLLRANDTRRSLPVRHLGAVASRRQARHEVVARKPEMRP